jgi:hypothetical protein
MTAVTSIRPTPARRRLRFRPTLRSPSRSERPVTIVNNGTTAISITASGVTLKRAGTASTGTRTLSANGVATLLKVDTNTWFISGAGLS